MRTYSELMKIDSFIGRFEYLQLGGVVGKDTFGFDRYLNQQLYQSSSWRKIRNEVILRDNGCDLGVPGRDICGKVYIHHLNPITAKDILEHTEYVLNPEYLICVSFDTHQAIHYGNKDFLTTGDLIIRSPNDTCLWR